MYLPLSGFAHRKPDPAPMREGGIAAMICNLICFSLSRLGSRHGGSKSLRLLGLHDLLHDGAAAAFEDGELLFAVEAERLTRRRFEPDARPALQHLLACTGLALPDFDLVVVSAPIRQRLVIVSGYKEALSRLRKGALHVETRCTVLGIERPCLMVAHEVSHAAAAVHLAETPRSALVLTNEGRGLWGRSSLFVSERGRLSLRANEVLAWYGTGFGWSALGSMLGFGKGPGVAGHLMAVAAYGERSDALADLIRSIGNEVLTDGGATAAAEAKIHTHPLFGRDFAGAARLLSTFQDLFTDTVVELAMRQAEALSAQALCISGGCGLNIIANSALRRLPIPVHVPPYCNDSGQALGVALYALQFVLGRPVSPFPVSSNGRAPRPSEIESAVAALELRTRPADPVRVAERLARGEIVAVCVGTSELGPRSLGNRSLLAGADTPGNADRVNRLLKRREWYRPLCASFSEQAFRRIWPDEETSPHMMFSYDLPAGVAPQCRHVDGSCRAHSVASQANPWFAEVLSAYEAITGSAGVINTSLNSAGRAIAYRPRDVLADFSMGSVDAYVFGDVLATRD